MKIAWLGDVAEKDYAAALAYLTLKLDAPRAKAVVHALRKADVIEWRRANDILRACGLQPLPASDPGVARTRRRVRRGRKLSPVLMVSYSFGGDIADGYHRVSAAYWENPFVLVPARIARVPSPTGRG